MNKKILIVDDEDDFCETLGSVLSDKGYEISKALDGKEALNKLNEFSPDLIVLDMVMPGMSGTEICKKIKKEPSFKDIPILMVTGYDSEDRKASGFISGADDYIVKSLNAEKLLERINDLLKRRN